MTATICRWALGISGAVWLLALSTFAFAQSSVLTNPVDPVAEAEQGEAAIPQIVPGMDNEDIAFVAVMLVLMVGLIWMWFRGQRMAATDAHNQSILNRAASRQTVAMTEAEMAQAKEQKKTGSDPDVQNMVASRMGLRSSD